MRSTVVREKMRDVVGSTQKPLRTSRHASTRGRAAMANAIEKLEKRVLYAAFYSGDIVVEQYGNGTAALTTGATPIFLDEYTPAGVLVQSVPLPTTSSASATAPNPATGYGTSAAEGFLTLSTDGHYLVVPAYGAAAGTPAVSNTASNGVYSISNASNASPAVIQTPSSAGASVIPSSGAPITIAAGSNADIAAGTYYAKPLTTTTFALYTDAGLMMGYKGVGTAANTAGGTYTSTSVARDIARIDPSGNIDTTTTLGATGLSGYAIRGAATTDGSNIYYDGSGSASSVGVVAFNSSSPTFLESLNSRAAGIYGNQLYVSSASGAYIGVNLIGGQPLPTSGTPAETNLFNSASGTPSAASPYGFFFATLNPGDTTPDTLYIEDSSKGLFKYTGGGTNWTYNSQTNTSTNALAGTGLTGSVSGTTVSLYITTPSGLYSLIDNSGYNNKVTATPTMLAANSSNESFRGVAFAPQPLATISVGKNPPATTNVVVGATATITAYAYGVGATTQWQVSTDGGNTFNNISNSSNYSGVTTSTLSILNATLSENGYEYKAVFTNAAGTVSSSASTLVVSDVPTFNFNTSGYTVNETAGTVTVTVIRTGDVTAAATVNYATSTGGTSGTATANTNYNTTSGTLNFPVNATSESFTVPIDVVVPQGGNKTFTVSLSSPVNTSNGTEGAAIGTGIPTSTVTIVDNQEVFNLSSGSYVVNDTDSTAEVSILRTGPYSADIGSVPITVTSGGAAYATGTAIFAAGQAVGVAQFNITGTGANQTLAVTLGTPTGFTGLASAGTATTATETVVDVPSGSATVTSTAGSTGDIETSGFYNSNYAPLVGDVSAGVNSNSFSYLAYEIVEFSPTVTPSLYPAVGSTVSASSIANLSLQMFNTDATTGDAYNGHPGNFNIYFVPDSDTTTPTAGLTYNATTATGLNPTQFTAAPVLLGTFSFNDTAGYDTYTPATSSLSSIQTTLANDLNSGSTFRLALTPIATGVGSIAVDWRGVAAGQTPILSLTDTTTVNKTQEQISFTSATYSSPESTPIATITLTRNGPTTDMATVNYATSNATAIAGTNYTATSGTATFAAGSSTATFNVSINNVVPQGGDKTLNLALSNPMTTSSSTVGVLGTSTVTVGQPQSATATLTITDTTTGSGDNLTAGLVGAATVEKVGVYDDSEFKAGGTSAAYASFGTIDFQLNNPPANPVSAIDSILLTINNVASTVSTITAGPVDFYLTSTATPLVLKATTPYYNTSNGIEGVGNQLGSLLFLGTYNVTDTTANDQVTIPLNGFSQSTENALISYINSNTNFRLVITPESAGVNADFLPGSANLVITTQEVTGSSLPPWLDPSSQATFNKTTETLTVTGPTTIVNTPSISGDQTVAIVDGSGATINFNVPSGTAIQAGSISLTNSSSASLANSQNSLLILGTNTFSVDSTSKFNLGSNYLDVASGNLTAITGYISSGYANGAWTGSGITSSTAKNNASQLTTLGAILNNAGTSAKLISSIDGQTLATTDVVVKYTYYGDATDDGKVDGSDYSRIDNGYLKQLTGWFNGDFNYDGVVNGSDYTLIDNAFNRQGMTFATPTAVIAAPAVPTAAPAAVIADSFFSDKKVKESLIGEVEDVITN